MTLVSYKLQSAIARGTKPDAWGWRRSMFGMHVYAVHEIDTYPEHPPIGFMGL